ncbi:ABC transporter substrate-binding protein [Microbacterium sp. NPDC008134]|uniref:ABC transporter substrate-binding protein n=1 Tax=Microbacterium sp. NPDC008134 TaxID=3364183 RepID=UPI0036E21AF6
MKTYRRRTALLGATIAAALLITACTPTASDPSSEAGDPVAGGTLHWGLGAQPAAGGVDPMVAAALAAQVIMDQSYETLLTKADDGTIEPGLATSWEQVDDLTWVFELREGVAFADGTEFTADDVVYTFETYLTAQTGKKAYLANMESVEATGDLEVTFRLSAVDGTFLNAVSGWQTMFIVGRDGYGNATEEERQTRTYGTGAFQVVDWQDGVSLTLDKNEHYWGEDEPYLDQIVFDIIPDESTRLAALQSGSIQGASFIDALTADQAASAGYTLGERSYTQGVGIYLNPGDGPLSDIRVRQAVSLALDRQALVDTAALGNGAISLLTPAGDPASPEITDSTPLYTRDLDAARALLEEAGQPNPTIQLSYFGDVAASQHPIYELMQQQLAEAGITLTLKATPQAELAPIYTTGESFVDMVALPGSYRPDPALYFDGFLSEAGLYNHWRDNPEADEARDLLAQVRAESDPDAKAELVEQLTDEVAEQVLVLMPLALPVYSEVWDSTKLIGYDSDPYTSMHNLIGSWLQP